MIAVFCTNVTKKKDAKVLLKELGYHLPLSVINFDLQDCDRILRIDTEEFFPQMIIRIVNEHGFSCRELE